MNEDPSINGIINSNKFGHSHAMSEIEESLKRISAHEGVLGVAILDDSGKLARSAARVI